MRLKILVECSVGLLATFGCLATATSQPSEPRLVLILSIDQGRAEYFDRFRTVLEGGLAHLLDAGVVFTEAHHNHANTSTGPGHASLATGAYPARSGIVANDWYDRVEARKVYCVEDRDSPILPPSGERSPPHYGSSTGRGPKRLLVTGLGDWIKERNPSSKVYSAGSKDRASVLMGSKQADAAFWFDLQTGQWVTSRYYLQDYPSWMKELHEERLAARYFGEPWIPLPMDESELARMEIVDLEGHRFPRTIGRGRLTPDASFYAALNESPFVDEYLFAFAKRLVANEGLGRDEAVDVLVLSFGSIDFVGHAFGPNSRELFDTFLRLDRELGAFLRFLDDSVGLEHVAIALSADHGVAPLPEYQAMRGSSGGRLGNEVYLCLQQAGRDLELTLGRDDWFVEPWHFDYETLRRRDVPRAEVETFVARRLAECPNVARVWTRTEIENATWIEDADEFITLYVNGFHPERSPDLYLQLQEGFMSRSRGTTHGSPYDYDTHVPMIVLWPGSEPKVVSERVHTVDLPVTLAALLGISPPETVDGMDRSAHLRRASVREPRPLVPPSR